MARFSASVTIRCPNQKVFDFLNDQKNFVGLNPYNFLDYRVLSANTVGAGVQSRFVLKTGVFREQARLKVTVSQSPALIIEEGSLADNPFRTTWKLKAVGDKQTELELLTEYTLSGPALLFRDRIQAAFVRIYTRLMTEIARKLNAQQAASEP